MKFEFERTWKDKVLDRFLGLMYFKGFLVLGALCLVTLIAGLISLGLGASRIAWISLLSTSGTSFVIDLTLIILLLWGAIQTEMYNV